MLLTKTITLLLHHDYFHSFVLLNVKKTWSYGQSASPQLINSGMVREHKSFLAPNTIVKTDDGIWLTIKLLALTTSLSRPYL
jgi:hypothetical protein